MPTLFLPSTPKLGPGSRFGILANTRVFESPLDKSTQTAELTGARWALTAVVPRMRKANAAQWRSFLTTLKGQSGRFFGFDPASTKPLGTNLGTPVVNGAAQTGESLNTKGWDPNEAGLLLAGDYFEVNGELKQVKYNTQVDSDGTGLATVEFIPSLRSSPADLVSIITVDPKATMMLTSDDQAFWNLELLVWGFSFSAIEAFS